MNNPTVGGMPTRQIRPLPEPQAKIDTNNPQEYSDAQNPDVVSTTMQDVEMELQQERAINFQASIQLLTSFVQAKGNICDLLSEAEVGSIGAAAVREWRSDAGSISSWKEIAERGLSLAAQDRDDDAESNFPWEDASDVHYPILTQAAQQWAARAYPELVKGDKAVGIKVFNHPSARPSPGEVAQFGPQPTNPQDAQASQMQMQQDQQQSGLFNLQAIAKNARGQRIAHYMNWCIFYKMDSWEADTDLLLNQLPITGSGFKKVYMTDRGLQSDYVSPLRLTVHADTKSIFTCPRITHDFDLYPYQIKEAQYSGRYNEITIPEQGVDSETPHLVIEQYRMDDLDQDGLPEPYIVTVLVSTQQVLRIEPAYGMDDIYINEADQRITRIERWQPFPDFKFLPDPRGGFYATGFAKLLDSITDSIDTSINQLMDAGSAEIAGGGFIGSNVRLQGSGQGGSIWFRPGEYQTVSTPGGALRDAIYERTVPHPSGVTLQLLDMLMAAAKDIASIKDVITGEGQMNAPVGTTLALQNQALQVFSSIYKRVYRGFRDEFRLMYECLKKFGGDQERREYQELTGGDFDEDFAGNGTDVQPVADPSVVTKMQKISRIQTLMQMAESPIGQAAGMSQPRPAQTLIMDALDILDIDRPERFISDLPPPNPMQAQAMQAKTAEVAATAELKTAQASKSQAEATLAHSKTLREIGLTAINSHEISKHADELMHGVGLNTESSEGDQNDSNPNVPNPPVARINPSY